MSFVDGIKSIFSRGHPAEVDKDKEGHPLYKEDIIGMVSSELNRRRNERVGFELQWVLNANFLAGHQNCDINTYSGEIEETVPLFDYQSRGVFNRISPLMETRNANLKSVKYFMSVTPRTNEMDDYEKAEISTKLLRYTQSVNGFERKKNTALSWAELTGTSFVMSWWNALKGDHIADEIIVEIDKDGNETQSTRPLYEGDVDFGLLTPYEVFPESIYKQEIEDQRSIIIEQVKTVDDVYDLYGLEVKGEETETYVMTPISGAQTYGNENTTYTMTKAKMPDSVKVVTYFEKPGRRYPHGRMAVVIKDELIYYGDLPFDEYPIVAIKSKPVSGQFFGKSVIQDLIPLQRAYNGCKNKVHDYIMAVAATPWLVPAGSIDVDDWEENGLVPGKMITFDANRGTPKPVDIPSLPATVPMEMNQVANDMEYVAGVSQLMVYGSAPSGVTSGTAINNLREIDSTRLSLTADNIREGILSLAQQWLKLYKAHVSGYRALKIAGNDEMGAVFTWCSDDINSYDIEFDTENELRTSPEKQQERFAQLWGMGAFTDENGKVPQEVKRKAIDMFKSGKSDEIEDIDKMQRINAQKENTFLQAGILPDVGKYDDHEIHVDVHKRFALSMDYKILLKRSPAVAEAFDRHVEEHQQVIQNKLINAQRMAAAALGQQGG